MCIRLAHRRIVLCCIRRHRNLLLHIQFSDHTQSPWILLCHYCPGGGRWPPAGAAPPPGPRRVPAPAAPPAGPPAAAAGSGPLGKRRGVGQTDDGRVGAGYTAPGRARCTVVAEWHLLEWKTKESGKTTTPKTTCPAMWHDQG